MRFLIVATGNIEPVCKFLFHVIKPKGNWKVLPKELKTSNSRKLLMYGITAT